MATLTTGTSGLANEVRVHYDLQMLRAAQPMLIHDKGAVKKTIPKREGQTVYWNRTALLSPALTPLTEGVTPAGNAMQVDRVACTVQQYGDFLLSSDVLPVTSIDDIMSEQATILGQQAGNTADIVIREVLNAGTNVRFTAGRTARNQITGADVLTSADLKKIQRTMAANNVPKLPGNVYGVFIHPYTAFDIQSMDEWVKRGINNSQANSMIEDGSIGDLYGLRFWETTNAKVFGTAGSGGTDVYSTVAFGANAYATVDLESMGLTTIVKQVGSAGTADPLNQRSSQGWKMFLAAARLNENFILRTEHATSG